MKKKKIYKNFIVAIFAIVLLFPIPRALKDGGTIEYRALLYKVSDVHSLAPKEDIEKGVEYNDGTIIEILGFEVYNSVK